MQIEEVKQLLESNLQAAQVTIEGDDYHCQAIIVSDLFNGKSKLQRQQLVYQALGVAITSGAIHAFSMQTYTPQEWEQTQHG